MNYGQWDKLQIYEKLEKEWEWEGIVHSYLKAHRYPVTDSMIAYAKDWNVEYPENLFSKYMIKRNHEFPAEVLQGIGSPFDQRNRLDPIFMPKLPDIVIKLLTDEAQADAEILTNQIAKYTAKVKRDYSQLSPSNKFMLFKGPESLMGSKNWQRVQKMDVEDCYYFLDIHKYMRLPLGEYGIERRYLCPEFLKIPQQCLKVKVKGIAMELDKPDPLKIASEVMQTGAQLTFVVNQKDQLYGEHCDYVGYTVRCLELEDMMMRQSG